MQTVARLLGAVLAAMLLSPTADAGPRGEASGYITAVSRYSNGTLTAPVRRSKWGYEVQLSGGAWIDCKGSCADTLREQKLDFWETLQENRFGGR